MLAEARTVTARGMRVGIGILLLAIVVVCVACGGRPSPINVLDQGGFERLADDYVETYLGFFPSAALAAGSQGHAYTLEHLEQERLQRWVDTNRITADYLEGAAQSSALDDDAKLDAALLRRRALQVELEFDTRKEYQHDPLFWTSMIANATTQLLAREIASLEYRLQAANSRALQVPRLTSQARRFLEQGDPAKQSSELFEIAARQLRGSSIFYRQGLANAASEGSAMRERLVSSGERAADAIDELLVFLEQRGEEVSGSPRLGDDYATAFRLYTGLEQSPAEVLADAERALADKIAEAADYGRSVWAEHMAGAAPDDDADLLRRLFERVAEDRAADVDAFEQQYRDLVDRAIAFTEENEVVTLPEELTLKTLQSPDYFVGQSVGGVYAAGPFKPDADTLFYLPAPPSTATDEQRDAFFRDFNDHFNIMIVPHEIVPGHYLQLKRAAQHPSRVRALFGDDVFIEGWGTFCERLMLDLGWGGSLDRLAHLKKQLENIARTIVDIRVHTQDMTRDEVIDFVQNEAFQDQQFAANMWSRSITSAPQLVSYWLGYRRVMGLYEDVRRARGEQFVLKEFMDAMLADGPVPVSHYRAKVLGGAES